MNFQFLGTFLLDRGIVTQAQIDEATAYQADVNRRLGDMAVEAGLLSPEQVEKVLHLQRETDMSFGALAVAKGFVSTRDMDSLLFRQHVHQVHLCEALLALKHLTPEQFCESLARYTAQEDSRRAALKELFLRHCGEGCMEGLVSATERAFLRFAHCPLKAQGPAAAEELEAMPYRFGSEIPCPGGRKLGLRLYLGADMLAVLNPETAGSRVPDSQVHEAVRPMFEIICRYLRKSMGPGNGFPGPCPAAESGESAAGGERLMLRLACPKAAIGLSVQLLAAGELPDTSGKQRTE